MRSEDAPYLFAREGRKEEVMTVIYRRPNTRRCYWQCLGCLKGYSHKCSPKCPGYLSVAQARRMKEVTKESEKS